jgi:hypothetical protein
MFQSIAPILIIYRVAKGKSLTSEDISNITANSSLNQGAHWQSVQVHSMQLKPLGRPSDSIGSKVGLSTRASYTVTDTVPKTYRLSEGAQVLAISKDREVV